MNSNTVISKEAEKTLEQVKETRAFVAHLFASVIAIVLLFVINLMTSPEYLWAVWALVGWGAALTVHGVIVYVKHGTLRP